MQIQDLLEALQPRNKSIKMSPQVSLLTLSFDYSTNCKHIQCLLSMASLEPTNSTKLTHSTHFKQSNMSSIASAADLASKTEAEMEVLVVLSEMWRINAVMSVSNVLNPSPRPLKRKYTSENEEDLVSESSKRLRISPTQAGVVKVEESPGLSGSRRTSSSVLKEIPKATERAGVARKKRNPKGNAIVKAKEDMIFRNIREALNARAANKSAYEAFEDARLPDNGNSAGILPFTEDMEEAMKSRKPVATAVTKVVADKELGDKRTLHPSEVALCIRLNLPYATYRCQKNRIFLGLAVCVAFYDRKLSQEPDYKARDIGVSQGQQFANIDVKVTSSIIRAFVSWKWLPEIVKKDPAQKGCFLLAEGIEAFFPPGYCLGLLQEVAKYEVKAGGDIKPIAHEVLSEGELKRVNAPA